MRWIAVVLLAVAVLLVGLPVVRWSESQGPTVSEWMPIGAAGSLAWSMHKSGRVQMCEAQKPPGAASYTKIVCIYYP
jgi:hypothetical protein